MAKKFFEKLSNNYIKLFESEEDYNVIIEVGKSPNTKEFKAHFGILKYRSLYFHNELNKKEPNNIIRIKLNPNISIQYFEIMIRYIYGGVFSLENLDASSIFDIMIVANELLLEEFIEAHWLRSHFAYVYKISFGNNQLQELQKWSNNIVVKYPNIIFESEEFTSLQENSLISIIKHDDLQLKEIEIWNYIIKWGIAKNPELPSELKDWTRENFQTLKATLKNYQQISSIILPPRITLQSTLPTRTTELFSTIITEEHKAEIATWIDKKTNVYDTTNTPYDFKLLLRGSRDGFTKDSFWNLCDNKANLVIVMKVKDTDEILGGYNPFSWNKSPTVNYTRCDKSFIFSLKHGNIQSSILSKVKCPQYAIYSYSGHGLNFGCSDLQMYNNFDQKNGCYCGKYAYEKQITGRVNNEGFSVSEYEVFQIHYKLKQHNPQLYFKSKNIQENK
ncbi:hypothetical protein C2G38_2256129 [Gigaspora rosea]|uniref:TLD-domain-containing protein n=1 Tax=Gigaspora rosea TaxID=44941 RepID=A0A397TXF4_9GLOM|nr:hypothetical protein C2G38_2256129 [Gigaspora rosea]